MTLDRIKQDAQLILESLYRYETLENKKNQEKNKKKIKEIEDELSNIRDYIISFSSEIKSMISEERLNIQKDERGS